MSLIDKYGSEHQKRVAAFMRGAGQAVPDTVTMPDVETRRLRARLILEEALETVHALGMCVTATLLGNSDGSGEQVVMGFNVADFGDHDGIEIIDGCCDLSVVLQGTLAAFGLPDVPFLEEVDRSNLAKLDGGWTDDTGKFRKPANWQPPDIAGVLHRIQQGDEV